MKTLPKLPTLWYENSDGDRWLPPPLYNGDPAPPEGFIYQHSRFPHIVQHGVLKITQKSEVDACPHDNVVATGGWVDGIEGRQCVDCRGTQTRCVGEDWPEGWCSGGCTNIMTGNSSYSEDLVLGLVAKRSMRLGEAILIASEACEKCMNTLAHELGLGWGYKDGSEDARRANTNCEICRES